MQGMTLDTLIPALILAGLANGVVIGAILLLGNRAQRAGLALGGLVLVAAAAGALILFFGNLSPRQAPMVLAAELALTLAAGPLLVIGMAGLTGQVLARRAVLIALGGAMAFTALAGWLVVPDPVVPAVLAQIGFTLWSWRIFTQRQPVTDRRTRRFRQHRLAMALLLAMAVLHAVQLARMALPQAAAMTWAVPGALALIMALATSALLATAARQVDLGAPSPPAADATARERIDSLLVRHFADPDLSGERLAELAAIPLAQLRRLYAPDGGIAAAIRTVRVEQAASQLADPRESETSIDAIALGCGFRSRSAFYQAFRKQMGANPGDYRERQLSALS